MNVNQATILVCFLADEPFVIPNIYFCLCPGDTIVNEVQHTVFLISAKFRCAGDRCSAGFLKIHSFCVRSIALSVYLHHRHKVPADAKEKES